MWRSGLTGALALTIILSWADFDRARSSAPQDPPAADGSAGPSLTIPPGQKFILQLETPIHTRTTKKGDRVEFTTAAPIMAENQVVIPNGSWVRGTVTKAKRAGRLFGRAEVNLKFDEVKLADGSQVPMKATITRVGFSWVADPKGGEPRIKGEAGSGGDLKGAAEAGAQGALIGILMGGARGAIYGGAAAAAITLAGALLKRGPDLDLPRDTMFEARFDGPVQVSFAAVRKAAQQEAEAAAENSADAASEGSETHKPRIVSRDTTNTDLPERPRPRLTRNPDAQPDEIPAEPKPPEPEPANSIPVEARSPEPEPTNPVIATPPTRKSVLAPAAEPVPAAGLKLSVSVRMVLVDTVVRDRAGRMIENLSRGDFHVYEDGVEQDINSFSRDELSLAVALVIDRSGSVAPFIAELRRIALRALQQLKPDDEVALFSFAGSVERMEGLTRDRQRIADAIDRVFAGGGTDIIDALYDATTYLAKAAPERRHAIILISDNQATVRPQVNEGEAIRTAMETETVVYSIKTAGERIPLGMRIPNLMIGAGSVSKVTEETGGEIIDARNVASLDSALGAVISRLRMRYAIGYYPSNPELGAFHAIQVKLEERLGKPGSDYFIHSRRGYYATAPKKTK
jgi:Ca-activated chloride channel homolog